MGNTKSNCYIYNEKCVYICFLLMVKFYFSTAQPISFINKTDWLPNKPFVGYLAKAVVDINKDGYDDIVRVNSKNKNLTIVYNKSNGQFEETLIGALNAEPISTTVGDVDNNGYLDVLTGGFFDGVLVRRNQGSNSFISDTIKQPLIWMQGANLVDINNDGRLDFMACNDAGLNQIWKNNRNTGFEVVSDWIDFRTTPLSNNSGNYGAAWSDIDNDGDLDLYIAKCSVYAMGPANASDPRRINQLFINHTYDRVNGQIVKNPKDFSINSSGWFSEEAAGHNLKISGQSWTADFADIDNDGDQDLLVTNHEAPTMLLENDGTGHFTDITSTSGLAGIVEPLQGLMRDFDNDGYVDILISGDMPAQLWLNNKNKTFTKIEPFGTAKTTSFAIGDINRDGFLDVYLSHFPKVDAEDELWINQSNKNRYLGINLQGSTSNRDGIGAKITLYLSDGTRQTREVRAGESYGISNSLSQLFGLGVNAEVLKVEVLWPSGQTKHLLNPPINQYLNVEEDCPTKPCIPIRTIVKK